MLDIDDTDDPVHGQRKLALFNAHYDCTCFQPIHIFDGLSGKPVPSLLRPGKRPSGRGGGEGAAPRHRPHPQAMATRCYPRARRQATTAASRRWRCWRTCAATASFGFSINTKLIEIAAPWREQCAMRRSRMKPVVRRFHQLPYRAREWSRKRKLIARVEATVIGTDVRFVVTSLEGSGKTLYEKCFCARGRAENLIKDMKRFTRSDKTACSRWQANQFRLFLHVGAYWLLHALRQAAPKRSRWRGATFETIRRAFAKVAVRIEELKERIKLAFPASYPQATMLVA